MLRVRPANEYTRDAFINPAYIVAVYTLADGAGTFFEDGDTIIACMAGDYGTSLTPTEVVALMENAPR